MAHAVAGLALLIEEWIAERRPEQADPGGFRGPGRRGGRGRRCRGGVGRRSGGGEGGEGGGGCARGRSAVPGAAEAQVMLPQRDRVTAADRGPEPGGLPHRVAAAAHHALRGVAAGVVRGAVGRGGPFPDVAGQIQEPLGGCSSGEGAHRAGLSPGDAGALGDRRVIAPGVSSTLLAASCQLPLVLRRQPPPEPPAVDICLVPVDAVHRVILPAWLAPVAAGEVRLDGAAAGLHAYPEVPDGDLGGVEGEGGDEGRGACVLVRGAGGAGAPGDGDHGGIEEGAGGLVGDTGLEGDEGGEAQLLDGEQQAAANDEGDEEKGAAEHQQDGAGPAAPGCDPRELRLVVGALGRGHRAAARSRERARSTRRWTSARHRSVKASMGSSGSGRSAGPISMWTTVRREVARRARCSRKVSPP